MSVLNPTQWHGEVGETLQYTSSEVAVGCRKSELTLVQSRSVISRLQKAVGSFPAFRIATGSAAGDTDKQTPSILLSKQTGGSDIGKSIWTNELELDLVTSKTQILVHSLKDMPTTLPPKCLLGAIPEREDASDAVIMRADSKFISIDELPPGSVVKGSSYGFAAGVTGGGSVKAAAPKDIKEFTTWLADSTPRVILIDKTFNFIGSEGSVASVGCYQKTCPVSSGGQSYIGMLSCTGSNMVSQQINNKSLVGVGSKGVIQGKGIHLAKGTKNIIIQNVHFTNINPGRVWGGDGVQIEGSDGVWIDHCKFSPLQSEPNPSRVTVSNSEFDGVTPTSATCNSDHYWTAMFFGPGDQITLDRNYWHDVSGRSPKLGADAVKMTVHATNNYFANNKGHDFDIYKGVTALLEGNVFESITTPMTSESTAATTVYNAPDSASLAACSASLDRPCVANSLSNCGQWPSLKSTAALSGLASVKGSLIKPIQASNVKNVVKTGAGVGKL
ncbi:pectin lyase [Colletotrichum kahawae]|uniref:hydroxymethylbilane synthase n=1 Tax=Colletotrichum kahawae TaxID=34407 RepID=A0AAD9YB37_COLKA|nr:pectin lyase [Colletotrichum kahawae]